ncbi:unnamed protein product [Ixodes pacificus]
MLIAFGEFGTWQIQITTLCVSISLSAYVALFCLFSPKIYIILCHPDKNVRKLTMNSATYKKAPTSSTCGTSVNHGTCGTGECNDPGCSTVNRRIPAWFRQLRLTAFDSVATAKNQDIPAAYIATKLFRDAECRDRVPNSLFCSFCPRVCAYAGSSGEQLKLTLAHRSVAQAVTDVSEDKDSLASL